MKKSILFQLAEKLNTPVLTGFDYTHDDRIDIRFNGKDVSECTPIAYYFGIQVKQYVNIWFKNYDNSDELFFCHFYNVNNGSSQKSYKRYFKFLQKHNIEF